MQGEDELDDCENRRLWWEFLKEGGGPSPQPDALLRASLSGPIRPSQCLAQPSHTARTQRMLTKLTSKAIRSKLKPQKDKTNKQKN